MESIPHSSASEEGAARGAAAVVKHREYGSASLNYHEHKLLIPILHMNSEYLWGKNELELVSSRRYKGMEGVATQLPRSAASAKN
jgi:hypothetical protein